MYVKNVVWNIWFWPGQIDRFSWMIIIINSKGCRVLIWTNKQHNCHIIFCKIYQSRFLLIVLKTVILKKKVLYADLSLNYSSFVVVVYLKSKLKIGGSASITYTRTHSHSIPNAYFFLRTSEIGFSIKKRCINGREYVFDKLSG